MRTLLYSFIFFITIVTGCKKNEVQDKKKPLKIGMSKTKAQRKIKSLSPYATQKIQNWTKFNELRLFFQRFENISPADALNNAVELKDFITKIKDNIPNHLNTSAFKSRLNVFENEALRLVDMSKIPAITTEEVNKQLNKTVLIYNSVTTKINSVFKEEQIDKEQDTTSFFKLENTKANQKQQPLKPSLVLKKKEFIKELEVRNSTNK